ncbi:MAG: apolipoprotein N-acyltransferase [Armatimonadota bacterium]
MSDQAAPLEFPVPPSRRHLLLALTVVSALASFAAFAPADIGGLGWIGLIPFLLVLGQVEPKQGFWHGWLFGLIFIGGNVAYVGQFGFLPLLALSAATALLLGLFGIIVSSLRDVAPILRVPAIAAAWSLIEYTRGHLGSLGLTVGDLAYSQHAQLGIIQIVSTIGHYGLGFIMVFMQAGLSCFVLALLPQTWFRPGDPRRFNRDAGRVAVVGFGIFIALFFGGEWVARSGSPTLQEQANLRGARVVAVQAEGGAIGRGARLTSPEALKLYLSETRKLGPADLIVWPETAVVSPLNLRPDLEKPIIALARELRSNLIVGATEQRDGKIYNSAMYYGSDGSLKDTYRKMDLVAFGEYVPFRDKFSFLKRYPIRSFDYAPGDTRKVLNTDKFSFSPLICFESIFPDQTREVARLGAEVLVVMTSDVWAGKTFEVVQHSHIDLFRAVEARKYLIRAATNGISAIYDPYGAALAQVDYFQDGSAAAKILPRPDLSTYHRFGDWPLLVVSVLLLFVGLSAARRRSSPSL